MAVFKLLIWPVTVGLLTFGGLSSTTVLGQDTTTTGDPQRGEALFTGVYKCYACHGFDAQTGAPRLKPMNYTEQGFTTFVNNSPLPQMPAYADVPASDLADIYAYILAIPVDAPGFDDIPLLQDILDRKLEALTD